MNNTAIITLAETLNYTRHITLMYFDKLKTTNLHQQFTVNHIELNSPYWIIAHLTVTENYLCLRSTGGEIVKFSWAKLFGLGSIPPKPEDCPPFGEIFTTFNEVHQKSVAHLKTLTDDQLELPTTSGIKFGGVDSYRRVISHAIAHEGTHAGQLAWLCKLHGIKTI